MNNHPTPNPSQLPQSENPIAASQLDPIATDERREPGEPEAAPVDLTTYLAETQHLYEGLNILVDEPAHDLN